jgi:kynureninase
VTAAVHRPWEFVVDDPDLVYLAGNSLGRLPVRTRDRLAELIGVEWGGGLVRSWEQWLHLPLSVGDRLGEVCLAAPPGTTVIADSVTVNLFKLAAAALHVRPGRPRLLTHTGAFPTDRYVLAGTARQRSVDVVEVPAAELARAVDASTAVVVVSPVDFTTGELHDLAAIADAARRAGALVLADLSHVVGAVPVDLPALGVDLATGCTYKYLNAGPGAPAFLYVAPGLDAASPIQGWFAHARQFAMEHDFDAQPGAAGFQAGTPNVAGVVAVGCGVDLLAEAGPDAVRAAAMELTERLADAVRGRLGRHGVEVASPADPARRGGHLALRHPDAGAVSVAAREAGVVGDHRPPDILRLAPAPLYVDAAMVDEAVDRLADVLAGGRHRTAGSRAGVVT